MARVLVHGLAVAGEATVRALLARGDEVVVSDDDLTPQRRTLAAELGVDVAPTPSDDDVDALVGAFDLVSPAPGVPETHPVVESAQRLGVPLVSEIELAYRWEQERPGGPRPMLAVTGTDGKTTTTLLTVAMLRAAGLKSVDAGNTDTPLVSALDLDVDAFVVECTSFRLAWTPTFRTEGAAWLNLAPDHLNWHRTMETYEAAKARIFANQRADDVAIGFVDDASVMRRLGEAPSRHVTFGWRDADYHVADGWMVGPRGRIAEIASMRRHLPHDVTNALAAAALVIECGLATETAVAETLATFEGPPHRLEAIGTWRDVTWFNDSKATTPHAAAAAIRSFDRVVLIAGGYDKHVDLTPMAAEPERVDAVIAVGTTAPAIAAAFAAVDTVAVVDGLAEAVPLAASIARPGQTVLLSPGCASLDQYRNFEARGDHFRELVHDIHHKIQRDEGDT